MHGPPVLLKRNRLRKLGSSSKLSSLLMAAEGKVGGQARAQAHRLSRGRNPKTCATTQAGTRHTAHPNEIREASACLVAIFVVVLGLFLVAVESQEHLLDSFKVSCSRRC